MKTSYVDTYEFKINVAELSLTTIVLFITLCLEHFVIEPLKDCEGDKDSGLAPIVQAMFMQLSVLGGLGLFMYIIEISGVLYTSTLFSAFKQVHIALFIVVLLFLLFGSVLTYRGLSQVSNWRRANHVSIGHEGKSNLVRRYINLLRRGESIPTELRDAIEFKSLRDRFVRDTKEDRKLISKLKVGDVVRIVKRGSSKFGQYAKVVNPTWNGRVQVTMIDDLEKEEEDQEEEKFRIQSRKSYVASEIELVVSTSPRSKTGRRRRRKSVRKIRRKRRVLLKVGDVPNDFELNDYFALRLGVVMAKMFMAFLVSMGYVVMFFTLYLNRVLSDALLELTSPYLLRCAHLEADVDKDFPLKRSKALMRDRERLGVYSKHIDIEKIPPYKLRPMHVIQKHHNRSWVRRVFHTDARFPNQHEYLLIGGSQGENFTLDLMRLISFAMPLYTAVYCLFVTSHPNSPFAQYELWIRIFMTLIFLVLPNIITFSALCDSVCTFTIVTSVEGMRKYDILRKVRTRMVAKKAGTALKLLRCMKHNMNLAHGKSWDPDMTIRSRALEVWPDRACRVEREHQIHSVFAHFDTDEDGSLNRVEIEGFLRKMCVGTCAEERLRMIDQILIRNIQSHDTVSFVTLFDWIAPIIKHAEEEDPDSVENLEILASEMFKMVKTNEDDHEITPLQFFTQVEEFMTQDDQLSLEDIQALFREFDEDDDGRLDENEFKGFVYKYCVE